MSHWKIYRKEAIERDDQFYLGPPYGSAPVVEAWKWRVWRRRTGMYIDKGYHQIGATMVFLLMLNGPINQHPLGRRWVRIR